MQMRQNWAIRIATFLLWMLLAASVVYWVLKFVQSTATPADAAVVPMNAAPPVDSLALVRGLGGGITPVASDVPAPQSDIDASRFSLTGVVVVQSGRQSIALIATDGNPARPYRVGTQVADGVVLQSVQGHQAALAIDKDAPVGATLELPRQVSAVSGTAIPVMVPQIALAPPVISPSVVMLPSFTPSLAIGGPLSPAPNIGQNPARPGASRPRPSRPNQPGRSLDKNGDKAETEIPAGAATQ
jgi:general secretion pathway protein C